MYKFKIYEPYLKGNSLKYAKDALDSSWISSSGRYKSLATDFLSDILGTENILLVNNGTSATHFCAKALLYKNKKIKNIIVPNNVYVAAWNCMLYENFKIHPFDSSIKTWNIDFKNVDKDKFSPDDTAILLVHNCGNIIDINDVKENFKDFLLIEDNCEGFLGKYGSSYSGTESLCSSISFFANKSITSGEGGAVIAESQELINYLDKVHGQGQTEIKYIHDVIGYNYRMTNIQAAILLGQLELIDEIQERKQEIFFRYINNLKNLDGIKFQESDPNTTHSNWLFSCMTNVRYKDLKLYLDSHGIESRGIFYPMSYHDHLKEFSNKSNEKNAQIISDFGIFLPSHPSLKLSEVDFICDVIKNYK